MSVRQKKTGSVVSLESMGSTSVVLQIMTQPELILYLGNKSKEYNKKAYDKLLSHKQEFESKLDTALIWHRNDDAKSSKISVVLGGVSIENESDWSRMAKFHAEWSKKFYDVMVSQYIL